MKKLLVLLTVILSLGLGACSPSQDVEDLRNANTVLGDRIVELQAQVAELENYDDTALYDEYYTLTGDLNTFINAYEEFDERDLLIADEDLQAQIAALDLAVTALIERFDNLVITTGLNGQQDFYENEGLYMTIAEYQTLAKESDYLDLSKFPNYIWDINGDYISIDNLGKLLVAKYFNGLNANATTGFQYKFTFTLNDSEMTNEEFIARLSLLIIELSYYDYYTIDSSQLYFYLYVNGQTVQLSSRMSLLVTDKYTLAPAIFFNQLLDVDISGIDYDSVIVQQYCDDYATNLTFDGFVLDYK